MSTSVSPHRLNQITALLLLTGLGSAALVYALAEPVFVDPLMGNPLYSKKHMHELRLMGGHANVALAEFQAWFASLWVGRQLGVTIAVLTLLAVPVVRLVARHHDLFNPHAPEPPSSGQPEANALNKQSH